MESAFFLNVKTKTGTCGKTCNRR